MKRLMLAVVLLACVGSAWAETYYDSSVVSVLELENNVTDSIGNTSFVTTNGGVPFSNVIYRYGSYSAGPASLNKTIQTNGYPVRTFEFDVYLPSSVSITTTQQIARWDSPGYVLEIDTNGNMIGAISINMGTLSRDTWTHIAFTFDGTNHKGYVDGVYKGQRARADVPYQFRITNGSGALFFTGYVDRQILSNVVKTSFPSLPDNTATPSVTPTYTATPTFTPTATVTPTDTPTATETVTQTVTQTVTPTYTPTVTPTKSSPVILTVTPNITPWWWWWSQAVRRGQICLLP